MNYGTQSGEAPRTIVLFVNNPVYLNETYQRFMVNRFRELLPYGEVPIKLVIRQRERQQGPGGGKPRGQGPVVSLDDAADVAPQSQKSAAALGRTAAKRGPARKAPARRRSSPSRGKGRR